MAQWLGYASGSTHESKVRDLESALRKAVLAWQTAADEAMRREKSKAVRTLAKRLLIARRRRLGARISAALTVKHDDRQPGASAQDANIAGLRRLVQQLDAGGVVAILTEFEAADAGPEAAP